MGFNEEQISHDVVRDVTCDSAYSCTTGSAKLPAWELKQTKTVSFCDDIPDLDFKYDEDDHQFTLFGNETPNPTNNCKYHYKITFDGTGKAIDGEYSSNTITLENSLVADANYKVTVTVSVPKSNIDSKTMSISIRKCFDIEPTFNAEIDGDYVRRIDGVPETGTVVKFTEVNFGKRCKGDELDAYLLIGSDEIMFTSGVQIASSFNLVVGKWNNDIWGSSGLSTEKYVNFCIKNSDKVCMKKSVKFCSIKKPTHKTEPGKKDGKRIISVTPNFLDGCGTDKTASLLIQKIELETIGLESQDGSIYNFIVPNDFFGSDLNIMLNLKNSALQETFDLSKELSLTDPKCVIKSVTPISPEIGKTNSFSFGCEEGSTCPTEYKVIAKYDDGTEETKDKDDVVFSKKGVFWIEYTGDVEISCETNKYRIGGNSQSSEYAIKLISPLTKIDKSSDEQLFVFEIDTSKLAQDDIKGEKIILTVNYDNATEVKEITYSASKRIYWETVQDRGSNFDWNVQIGNAKRSIGVKVCKPIKAPTELECNCDGALCTFSWRNDYENLGNPYMELTLESKFISERTVTVTDTTGRVSGNKFIKRVEFESDPLSSYSTTIDMNEIFQMSASPIGDVTASVANICGDEDESSAGITFKPCLAGITPEYPNVSIPSELSNELYVEVELQASYKNICGTPRVTVTFEYNSKESKKSVAFNNGKTKVAVDNVNEIIGENTSGSISVNVEITAEINELVSNPYKGSINLCFDVEPVNVLQDPTSESADPYIIYPNGDHVTLNFPFEKKILLNNCESGGCKIELFDGDKSVGTCDCEESMITDVNVNEGQYSFYIKEKSGSVEGRSEEINVSICKLSEMSEPKIAALPPGRKYYSPPFKIECTSDCEAKGCVNNGGVEDPCNTSFEACKSCEVTPEGDVLTVQAAADGQQTFSCSVTNEHFLGYYGSEAKVPKKTITVNVCNLKSPGPIKYLTSSIKQSEQSTGDTLVFEQLYKDLGDKESFSLTVKLPDSGSSCAGESKSLRISHVCDGEFDVPNTNNLITRNPEDEISYEIPMRNATDVFFGMVTCKITVTNIDQQSSEFNYIFVLCDEPKKSTEKMYPDDNAAIVKTSAIFKWDPLRAEDVGRSCNISSPSRSIIVYVVPESVANDRNMITTKEKARESVKSFDFDNKDLFKDYSYHLSFRAQSFDFAKITGEPLKPTTRYLWQTQVYNGYLYKNSSLLSFTTRSTDCRFCKEAHATCIEDDLIDKATCECHSGYKGYDCSQKELTALVTIFVPIVVVFIVLVGVVIAFLMWRKVRSERIPKPDLKALQLLPVDPKEHKDDITATEQLLLNDPKFMFSRTHELIENSNMDPRLLVALYYAYAKQGCDLDFLCTILVQEISETEQFVDQETTQSSVQDKTAGTMLYGIFCRLYGLEYMWTMYHKLLEKFLKDKKKLTVRVKEIGRTTSSTVSTKSFTVSSDSLPTDLNESISEVGDDEPENQALYIMYSASLLVKIITNTQSKSIPVEFAALFAGLRKGLIEIDLKEDISVHLLLLFVQKFIIPVLASGYLGVYPSLDDAIRKQLNLIKKVLDNTIRDRQFEIEPSKLLYFCNPFIDQYADTMRSAILNICDAGTTHTSVEPSAAITNELYQDCLQVIQEFLDKQDANDSVSAQDSAEAFNTPTKQIQF